MTVRRPRDQPFDMTLRMWSDRVPLKPLLDPMGIRIAHLHILGKPMTIAGHFPGRIARRNYASIAETRGNDDNDVSTWLTHIIGILKIQHDLVDKFRTGQIEALLWIAIFGNKVVPVPSIDPCIVNACEKLGLQIFLENYTDFDDEGIPKKLWLPETKSKEFATPVL